MSETVASVDSFDGFELRDAVLQATEAAGYTEPTPIQAQTIPIVLAGKDLLAQAQTGTGKTAAFALPLLTRIKMDCETPQVLVLAPTRELAIQVAESFKTYAKFMKQVRVLAVYGGADMRGQLRELKRGPQIVVGTP